MVNNIKPINFGDDTQMHQSDGKVQVVSNNVVIITLVLLTEGASKKTIVHVGNPQQYSTMRQTITRLNFKPTWDVKTHNQKPKCDVTPPKLSPHKTQVYLTNLDSIINCRIGF